MSYKYLTTEKRLWHLQLMYFWTQIKPLNKIHSISSDEVYFVLLLEPKSDKTKSRRVSTICTEYTDCCFSIE